MNPMRRVFTVAIVTGLAFAAGTVTTLHSQQNPPPGPANPSPLYAPLYVTTFIDLMPPGREAGTEAIKQYVLDTRREPGILRCEAIAQIAGRSNHLEVMEVWKDEAAFEKHETLAHTLDYRAKMAPLMGAPFDQREHFLVE
jgi:quinol monooxygenase YgiN